MKTIGFSSVFNEIVLNLLKYIKYIVCICLMLKLKETPIMYFFQPDISREKALQ